MKKLFKIINNYMKELKAIALKIDLDRNEYFPLLEQCRELFNDYIKWIYKNGTYNKNKIHRACYRDFIQKYPQIKVALQQTVRDMASEVCKRSKIKNKRPEKKSLSVRLNRLCFTLRGQQLTLIGQTNRHKEILHIPEYYKTIFETWTSKGAILSYSKKTKQFWLHITFENPKEPKIISQTKPEKVLGIDRGVYNPIALSNGTLTTDAKMIRRVKSDYQHLRQQLQKKGTRSAKQKLKIVSGKEKRFVLNMNHILSKQVANGPYDIFILENLKKIKKNKYHKKLNRKLMNWSFFQFERLLNYKANALGKIITKIIWSFFNN